MVLPMSRIAKRPSSGKSAKVSMAMGVSGSNRMTAPSPVLRNAGFSSTTCPDRGSSLLMSSTNRQATWAVWAWSTGVYPAARAVGW